MRINNNCLGFVDIPSFGFKIVNLNEVSQNNCDLKLVEVNKKF